MEPRYWLLTAANEDNKIAAVQNASGMWLAALVDERAGGVIGYLLLGEATRVVERLNAVDMVLNVLVKDAGEKSADDLLAEAVREMDESTS